MAITARLARAWTAGAIICLILLGSATGALGARAVAAAPTARASTALGRGGSVPQPGRSSGLSGLSCPSRRSCWAVGSYTNRAGVTLNQALHWNGARWSVFPVPSPGGTARLDFNELAGVSCVSPRECWAVGSYAIGPVASANQALHWNGARWSSVSVPSPGGIPISGLTGVSCVSPGDCWAVGSYSLRNTATLNQALHWNGRRWRPATTPSPGGTGSADFSGLSGVSCAAPGDCWAVGSYGTRTRGAAFNQALRWNGARWSSVSIPTPAGPAVSGVELAGVSCNSPAECWAVGSYGAFGGTVTFNQALLWNGRRWRSVATPDPGGSDFMDFSGLSDVSCAAPGDCWAVGAYGPSGGGKPTRLNQALHWNGRRWSLIPTPDLDRSGLPSNELTSARCTSSASCWAVGGYDARSGADLNQALRWNGTRWSLG